MRNTVILFSLMLTLLVLASCSKKPFQTDLPAEPAGFDYKVTADKVLEKGYYSEKITADTEVSFYVANNDEKDSQWSIYVVDDELTDEEIEALKSREPDLINNGDIEIEYGKWIYVFCDGPTEDVLHFGWMADFA